MGKKHLNDHLARISSEVGSGSKGGSLTEGEESRSSSSTGMSVVGGSDPANNWIWEQTSKDSSCQYGKASITGNDTCLDEVE